MLMPNIYQGFGLEMVLIVLIGYLWFQSLKNRKTAEAYGDVVNENIREILQAFVIKVVHGEEPELYNNEIDGVNEVKWEVFPSILTVSKNKIQSKTVKDSLKNTIELLQAAGLEE